MSSMKEKMHTGELYLPGDEEIMKGRRVYRGSFLCKFWRTSLSFWEDGLCQLPSDLCG